FMEDPRFRDMDGMLQSKMKEQQILSSDIKEQVAKHAEVSKENDSTHWDHEESETLRNEKSASISESRTIRDNIERQQKNAGYDEKKEALEKEIAELHKKVEESESATSKKQESTGSVYGPEDKAHIEHLAGHLTKGGECPVCRQT